MKTGGGPMRAIRVHLKVHGRLHGLTHHERKEGEIFKDFFGESTFTDPAQRYKGLRGEWGSMRGGFHRKLDIGAGVISETDRYSLVRGVCFAKEALGKLPHLSHFFSGGFNGTY